MSFFPFILKSSTCDNSASRPAAVWAGKHKKYEPKWLLMPKHAWDRSVEGEQLWTMFGA